MDSIIDFLIDHRWQTIAWIFIISWASYQFLKPYFSPYRHIIRPKQTFFLFRLFSEPKAKQLEQWMDELPHQGLIRYYGLNNVERIYVANPETTRDLLVREAYKFVKPELQYVLAQNIASNGLLIQEGEAHKQARKALNPAFSPAQMRDLHPIALKTSAEMLDRISNECRKSAGKQGFPAQEKAIAGEVAPLNIIHGATIDVLGRWAYSVDFNVLKDPKSILRPYIGMFKQSWRGQITFNAAAVIGARLALKLPLRAVRTMQGVMKIVRETSDAIVEQHLPGLRCTGSEKPSSQTKVIKVYGNRQDLISTTMKSNYFSQEGLVDQTVHMLAAATETSSGTLSWIVHLLSRYPEMQTMIRDEVRQSLPSPKSSEWTDSPPQAPVFNKLTHLNAFIKEVLRFHSINTVWWRQCIGPATIGGEAIRPGTIVSWSPWAIARDPKHWGADAREFKPQRWIERPSGGATSDASWIIFGAGPRRCIGEQYAYAQIQAIVATLVGRFEVLPLEKAMAKGTDEGHELGDDAALTLFKIMDGWKLRFREVPGW